jgi:hypothetical protein
MRKKIPQFHCTLYYSKLEHLADDYKKAALLGPLFFLQERFKMYGSRRTWRQEDFKTNPLDNEY